MGLVLFVRRTLVRCIFRLGGGIEKERKKRHFTGSTDDVSIMGIKRVHIRVHKKVIELTRAQVLAKYSLAGPNETPAAVFILVGILS